MIAIFDPNRKDIRRGHGKYLFFYDPETDQKSKVRHSAGWCQQRGRRMSSRLSFIGGKKAPGEGKSSPTTLVHPKRVVRGPIPPFLFSFPLNPVFTVLPSVCEVSVADPGCPAAASQGREVPPPPFPRLSPYLGTGSSTYRLPLPDPEETRRRKLAEGTAANGASRRLFSFW